MGTQPSKRTRNKWKGPMSDRSGDRFWSNQHSSGSESTQSGWRRNVRSHGLVHLNSALLRKKVHFSVGFRSFLHFNCVWAMFGLTQSEAHHFSGFSALGSVKRTIRVKSRIAELPPPPSRDLIYSQSRVNQQTNVQSWLTCLFVRVRLTPNSHLITSQKHLIITPQNWAGSAAMRWFTADYDVQL